MVQRRGAVLQQLPAAHAGPGAGAEGHGRPVPLAPLAHLLVANAPPLPRPSRRLFSPSVQRSKVLRRWKSRFEQNASCRRDACTAPAFLSVALREFPHTLTPGACLEKEIMSQTTDERVSWCGFTLAMEGTPALLLVFINLTHSSFVFFYWLFRVSFI